MSQANRKQADEPVQYCVGHVTDDLEKVAAYIVRLTGRGTCQVWIDLDASFNVGLRLDEFLWPSEWLVGVYSAGVAIDDLRDDLESTRAQWATMFLIDESGDAATHEAL